MFDKVFEFIGNAWEDFCPFAVLNEFERGVVLRFGKYSRRIGPGLHFKLPFIEEVWSDTVVPRTINLMSQTLTTKDGKTVVVSSVITTIINDVKKALLCVDGVDNAMEDICYGLIGDMVLGHTWDEILALDVSEVCRSSMNEIGAQYGIEITNVQFQDIAYIKTYRIMR